MNADPVPFQAPTWRLRIASWIEAGAVMTLGFVIMHLFYAGSVATSGSTIGVPAHDSFYHITMAALIPDVGALREFRWLEYTYFLNEGDGFVSHHWGFHLLLMPFILAAQWITGDPLVGGRWATSAIFGVNLLLFHLLLRSHRVPFHWLWVALFFLLPDQFFARHGFVRAIGASFMFMQLILLCLFQRRIWLGALAVGSYVHLYLGAVMFGPILVGTFALAQVLAPVKERQLPWKMVLVTATAWGIGVLTYPYVGGVFEFLKIQVFGSGLSPDIEVGREWKPYTNPWFLVSMASVLLATWVTSLLVRLRFGPRLKTEEITLMVLQFAFLALTLKARRFIEYWPPVCLLSAAYLATPSLLELRSYVESWLARRSHLRTRLLASFSVSLLVGGLLIWRWIDGDDDAMTLLTEWPVWFAPIIALLISYSLRNKSTGLLTVRIAIAVFLPLATLAVGAPSFARVSRQLRCYYDLDAVESLMSFVTKSSEPGDIIFTDDWDIFPLFFHYNRHNHYIVGLDPKFTHQRDPDLWNRYVKISRGQVPSTIRLASSGDKSERSPVVLEDIRDHFRARYVITDPDHRSLSDALADASSFAELVYPTTVYEDALDAPYLVFRVRDKGEVLENSEVVPADTDGPLYLGDQSPVAVSQGWGNLRANRSVDGNPIRLDGRTYARGIGTHAPARILYNVPPGYDWFEAVVGIDDETEGHGSAIASVLLDGKPVYKSPTLLGRQAPSRVQIPLNGARQIQLEADATRDGQQFDHVSWGNLQLTRSAK